MFAETLWCNDAELSKALRLPDLSELQHAWKEETNSSHSKSSVSQSWLKTDKNRHRCNCDGKILHAPGPTTLSNECKKRRHGAMRHLLGCISALPKLAIGETNRAVFSSNVSGREIESCLWR